MIYNDNDNDNDVQNCRETGVWKNNKVHRELGV